MLNVHLFLPDNSRQRIIDLLSKEEKFGLFGIQQQDGKPYYDTAGTPRLTIGYGFNLEGDPDRLQLVLNQIYSGANPAAVAQFKNGGEETGTFYISWQSDELTRV